MKYCVQCRFHCEVGNHHKCSHRNLIENNPVTGVQWSDCFDNRNADYGECGLEGRFFEPLSGAIRSP